MCFVSVVAVASIFNLVLLIVLFCVVVVVAAAAAAAAVAVAVALLLLAGRRPGQGTVQRVLFFLPPLPPLLLHGPRRNARLAPTARSVYDLVRRRFRAQFDDAQSIGRRYRRQDEIGTPYCVTVDFDTLDDQAVTIRDRDTMAQERIPIADLLDVLQDRYDHGW